MKKRKGGGCNEMNSYSWNEKVFTNYFSSWEMVMIECENCEKIQRKKGRSERERRKDEKWRCKEEEKVVIRTRFASRVVMIWRSEERNGNNGKWLDQKVRERDDWVSERKMKRNWLLYNLYGQWQQLQHVTISLPSHFISLSLPFKVSFDVSLLLFPSSRTSYDFVPIHGLNVKWLPL